MIDKHAIKARREALSGFEGTELGFLNWTAELDNGTTRVSFTLTILPTTYHSRMDWIDFIAHAPTDMADLLKEVERLEGELAANYGWKMQYELVVDEIHGLDRELARVNDLMIHYADELAKFKECKRSSFGTDMWNGKGCCSHCEEYEHFEHYHKEGDN